MVAVHFLLQSQGGTGEFMYKASILGIKQLLSNMIDREATQVPHTTRIAFLTDSYRVSAAIMRHLRLLQYYYLQEAYWDFNFGIDIHQLI